MIGLVFSEAGSKRRLRARLLAVIQGVALLVVLALLALLVWRVVHRGSGATLVRAVAQGQVERAPAFSLPVIWPHTESWPSPLRSALDDGVVSLAELRGSAVVVNFWASWCIPCREEAPFLAASARVHRSEVAFLGVDVQDFTIDARRFLSELEVPYVSVRDSGPRTYAAYGLTGVPETYYVDRRGRVVAHSVGAISRPELERGVARSLGSKR